MKLRKEQPQQKQKKNAPSARGPESAGWHQMNRKQRREMARKIQAEDLSLEVVHPHAAGIDIGNESHYVAVPSTRDEQPVRRFGCTTAELKAMAAWLKQCGIRTVALQSTGVYWIPVYDILEAAGLEVYLVNARETKNLPGRKTDVQESQWLMKLHTYGLLRNSFRPSQEIRSMRSYWRQRQDLVQSAVRHIQRMQKALTQMNIQLANVLSDITGKSGQAILHAILEGERDPHELAALCQSNVKASEEEIARSLEGNWREDSIVSAPARTRRLRVLSEAEGGMRCTATLSRAKGGSKRGRQPPGRETQTTGAQEQEESSAVRPARAIISHRRDRPDTDRWHRCSDRHDRDQRSGMGHEQMAQRRPFCFLVTPFSGQPSPWRPRLWRPSSLG